MVKFGRAHARMASSVRVRKRVYCPHCEESISHAAYYRRRDMYFNRETDHWMKEPQPMPPTTVNYGIDSDSSSESNSVLSTSPYEDAGQ